MKYLLLLLLFTSTAFAANFMSVDKIGVEGSVTVFTRKKACESHYSKTCIRLPLGYNKKYHVSAVLLENDYENPIYEAKSDVVTCLAVDDDPLTTEIDETLTQEEDCIAKAALQVCDNLTGHFMVRVIGEVYCTKIVSYPQIDKGRKQIVIDQELKGAYETIENTIIAARLQEKSDRDADVVGIKAALNQITNSNLPLWHKKLLKRLVRDMK